MTEINIDPKEVRREADKLRSCVSQIREESRLFRQIEDEIESSWKSSLTRQYLNCLENTEGEIERSLRAIENTADKLKRIAADVERTEAEIQQVMSDSSRGRGGGGGHSF